MRTRPLPIRVEPFEDEPWSGYLERVALRLDTTTRTIRRALGVDRGWRTSAADWGVAMTEHTRVRCAGMLNLDPHSVEVMLLQRFHNRVLDFPPEIVEVFDPLTQRAPSPVHAAISRAGWMYARPASRACPECLREQPGRWYLSWRLPWHLHCGTHGQLIVSSGGESSTIRADRGCMSAERELLDRAYGVAGGRASLDYITDVCAIAGCLISSRTGRAPSSTPPPEVLRSVLADAVHAADGVTARGEVVLASLREHASSWFAVQRALRRYASPSTGSSAARLMAATYSTGWISFSPAELRAPGRPFTHIPSLGTAPGWAPEQMPMEIFVGDLSDVLYPLRLRHGRHVAAIGCLMLTTGCTLRDGIAALGNHWQSNGTFQYTLHQLETAGREDQFWHACAGAADRLEIAGVDYAHRLRLARDETFRAELATLLPTWIHAETLEQWLIQEWAGARLVTTSYLPAYERELDALPPDLVSALRAVADQLATGRPASMTKIA